MGGCWHTSVYSTSAQASSSGVPSGNHRPALPCGIDRLGSSRSSTARLRRSCTRSSRSVSPSASSSNRSSWPTSRGLQLRPIPARPPRWKRRSVSESFFDRNARAVLVHSTRRSNLRMAAGMDHVVEGPDGTESAVESGPDVGRLAVATELAEGARLRVVKFIAYGWSSRRSEPALRDAVAAALTAARHTGWDGLLGGQRAYLDEFWESADVELEGDLELQQAVRFALFHTLQAGARAEQRAIAAKGLTGPGYDGHTFWDTERFVLPVLTYTAPRTAGDALRWRHATLDLARDRARQLGLAGAAFPWRTIRGQECSGYWPAGTAAFHIGGDIADAVARYLYATDDEDFERDVGLELLVEPARLWRSLGHHDSGGTLPNRRGHRSRRVQRNRRQQRLHQPGRAAEPARRRGRGRSSSPPRRRTRRRPRGSSRLARRSRKHDRPMGQGARRPSPVRRLHEPSTLGLRAYDARPLPAAPPLPLLRSLPQAGRQAGRPRSRLALARRRFLRRGEGSISPTTKPLPSGIRRCQPARRP